MRRTILSTIPAALVFALCAVASAQTPAKPQPLLDPNTATEKELASGPITPAIAKAIVARRPYATVVEFDRVLTEQKLTPEQIAEVHARVFVPLNLNTAADAEILAIPGIGKRMLHEFKEYRPYKSMDQFRREIGKYIDRDKRDAELARLERYVVIK